MDLKELFDYLLERVPDASGIHVSRGDETISVSRGFNLSPSPAEAVPYPAHGAAAARPAGTGGGEVVRAPLVGVFYTAPSPDAEPFVREGSRVRKGDTLCIIEAMKLMNEIESTCGGVVGQVLAENGAMVEYGQPLFEIRAE
ncbi:MAG: acetyl-CoA carboxylase, biotin carboxyl carrier protein [Oscillospiraceae bacterium]|jgi:acetyl-CoA carboxylase biotin carboxyl carrier protein|nr:acetyl-CoA carboxylase, biotin carboxyl carrier protein [Oscillospiraceae bacterium]